MTSASLPVFTTPSSVSTAASSVTSQSGYGLGPRSPAVDRSQVDQRSPASGLSSSVSSGSGRGERFRYRGSSSSNRRRRPRPAPSYSLSRNTGCPSQESKQGRAESTARQSRSSARLPSTPPTLTPGHPTLHTYLVQQQPVDGRHTMQPDLPGRCHLTYLLIDER